MLLHFCYNIYFQCSSTRLMNARKRKFLLNGQMLFSRKLVFLGDNRYSFPSRSSLMFITFRNFINFISINSEVDGGEEHILALKFRRSL